ncbi:MAG: MBL fold metallo-hydrolase [Planctomycetes bacterium]|nr:MBL fold metallo-hydrolase [Planctomycetota bacterium]
MPLSLGQSAKDDGIIDVLESLDARSFSFRLEAQGSRWDPLQALRPEGTPLHPSDFSVVAVHELDRMRLSWERSILEPLTATVPYDEIVVGNEGYISAPDVALGPTPAHPMTSDRLAAVRRQQWMLNPHLLVGDALRRQEDTGEQTIRYIGQEKLNGTQYGVIEINALPRPIQLFINLDTKEITRLVTQENDYPCGDVEIAVAFSDWSSDSGYPFPYQAELSWDGVVIQREIRKEVKVNPQLEPGSFDMPETLPFDAKVAERGLKNAQWIHRATAMGAPISLDSAEVVMVPFCSDVISIGGGIHHSMAIPLDSGVVVVDSPLHEERSQAVIKAVTAQWPDKPITHLILTHHHHDHSGGIRAFAALGAELIIVEGDRDFIAQCLERPHTITPDSLSLKPNKPTITTVGANGLSLGDGEIQMYRIPSSHCDENLVVYIASDKLLFNADLFNPGLVPPGVSPPPFWLVYSREFVKNIEALNLDIEVLLGAHGVPEGGPYQELIDFTK